MVRYGRGKFEAHERYIKYMHFIASHKTYQDMPNAIDPDSGRVNWQVSSGKGTSFYDYYKARFEWWEKKADSLGLPGSGNSNERFSIAARLIHPTGKRPCRLCGNEFYVGYRYVNHYLSQRWNKIIGQKVFEKGQEITEAAEVLRSILDHDAFLKQLKTDFPERDGFFSLLDKGEINSFFSVTGHIRSSLLSPGFMCNPPDRLDGFHDYGGPCECRKTKDPGRHEANMRSYIHDRRAFMWWSEGDWFVADALYNAASHGVCSVCGRQVTKISPDHVGPLSCGFKHLPFYAPLCPECNASKNRRMTMNDISMLREFEERTGTSVASFQVRAFWDLAKLRAQSDEDAKDISNIMRSLQDYYLRTLYHLLERGHAHFLTYLLSPYNAFYQVIFEGLDPATLSYKSYRKAPYHSNLRTSLARRIVRIAFEELKIYNEKGLDERKLTPIPRPDLAKQHLKELYGLLDEIDLGDDTDRWNHIITSNDYDNEERETEIGALLGDNHIQQKRAFEPALAKISKLFDSVGTTAADLLGS